MSGCVPNEPEWGACDLPAGDHGAAQVQEYRADFATPGHTLEHASLDLRPDAITMDMLEIPCVGPDHVADPSKGLLHRVWKVNAREPGRVTLARCSHTVAAMLAGGALPAAAWHWEEEVEVFRYEGAPITEVDLGFDQNGNIVVCAERAGQVWLYWFDPRVGEYSFQMLGPCRTPRILLDDPETTTESDLLLFYANTSGTAIWMRQQRELYAVVHSTPASGADLRCEEVAKASDYRLHVYYSRHNAESGRYELVRMESAPYPVRLAESLESSQRMVSAAMIEYVRIDDQQRDELQSLQFVHEIVLQELTLRIGPDGNEGWLSPDSMQSTQRLAAVERQDLVQTHTQEPDRMQPSQRLASALLQTSVIVAPDFGADKLQQAQRISSISLVTA